QGEPTYQPFPQEPPSQLKRRQIYVVEYLAQAAAVAEDEPDTEPGTADRGPGTGNRGPGTVDRLPTGAPTFQPAWPSVHPRRRCHVSPSRAAQTCVPGRGRRSPR